MLLSLAALHRPLLVLAALSRSLLSLTALSRSLLLASLGWSLLRMLTCP
jgi:hypothetical protein